MYKLVYVYEINEIEDGVKQNTLKFVHVYDEDYETKESARTALHNKFTCDFEMSVRTGRKSVFFDSDKKDSFTVFSVRERGISKINTYIAYKGQLAHVDNDLIEI